ncbi:MAG: helix-hairpin-helix domain-containing protein [Candidatus Eisenbacteria bacterium]
MKRADYTTFEQIPNVGPATAGDLRLLGFEQPAELVGQDAYRLYERLCRKTGQRHDPCVIDVFLSVIRFMEGAPAKPWWAYTAERKRTVAAPVRERSPQKRRAR